MKLFQREMPQSAAVPQPRDKLLSFEEICELAGIFTEVGIEKVRLTGGEPLLRKDLPVLDRMLAQNPRIRDLALTTKGVLLAGQAQALWDAGLHRLTISLDTLRPDRFLVLTRRDAHALRTFVVCTLSGLCTRLCPAFLSWLSLLPILPLFKSLFSVTY